MASTSALVLVAFIGWALALLILMEASRVWLVASGRIAANAFTPDNAGLSPFMQRLARAHANCIEGLPIFGGLLIAAIVTGKTGVTDPLAYWLLGARLVQSVTHLVSISVPAVNLRFAAFVLQMAIAAYWTLGLLAR